MALGTAPQLLASAQVTQVLQIDGSMPLHTAPVVRGRKRHTLILGARRVGVAAEGRRASAREPK